ncbi:MAG TPA: molybdopterin-dependent oxidoreductase [Ktedonobacterales bacterium]|nr:molybdopterin-dependent oxidoreductase [Ktedonobacterales bacterium]
MTLAAAGLGFPAWLRAAHWINVLFIGLLARSGVQILASYPRLYWKEGSIPGTEWLKFTKWNPPKDPDVLWTTLEAETAVSPWLAQPGGDALGGGRHWHFFSITFWILNGVIYVILLFATGEWQRLIPTSWSIIPAAWQTFITYATFHLPPPSASHPYDPLQQLSYAAVVFLLGPYLILTGAAQSPAVEAQFPWYVWLFGGRQSARSLHFLGLLAVIAFTIVHTALVVITGLGKNLSDIVLGTEAPAERPLAYGLGLGVIALIIAIYAVTAWWHRRQPRLWQHLLGAVIEPPMRMLTLRSHSQQEYKPKDISPQFLINGKPPESAEYLVELWQDFCDYRLRVEGLVAEPLELSLDDLKAMPKKTQITKHNCIQGWSAVAEWGGVPVSDLLARCQPSPKARFIVCWSYSRDTKGTQFYEVIPIEVARHPQTILAYEMNGEPLPMPHGAPLRLRAETLLGFKMTKWIRSIELVEDYASIREGQGGSREDNRYNELYAAI